MSKLISAKATPIKNSIVQNPQTSYVTPQTPRVKATVMSVVSNSTSGVITQQKNTLVSSNAGQIGVQGQIIGTGAQVINANQLVTTNVNLAQQLVSGKAQLATVGGHQVIIRSTPVGNQIVHLNSTSPGIVVKSAITPKTSTVTVQPSTPITSIQTSASTMTSIPITTTVQTDVNNIVATSSTTSSSTTTAVTPALGSAEASLLATQPPGTVIKCVTAQVIQTNQGPRIVLQGLQGADFTAQQLTMVQQQVKQQLLKAQATTGKQGVLGPTKIYLAVQPATSQVPSTIPTVVPTSVAPVTPLKQVVKSIVTPLMTPTKVEKNTSIETTKTLDQSDKPKVVVQQVSKIHVSENEYQRTTTMNGEQLARTSNESNEPINKFILTPDYIQQTIKNALKQENLNPEIEEKLLQLQRYQEKQMKGSIDGSVVSTQNQSSTTVITRTPARKRPAPVTSVTSTPVMVAPLDTQAVNEKDMDHAESPRKKIAIKLEPKEPLKSQKLDDINDSQKNRAAKLKDVHEARKKQQVHSRMQVLLFRHKELLKKDILKKRALLEKELQIVIQRDLSAELTTRTKAERHKQDEVKIGSAKKKTNAQIPQQVSPISRGGKTKKYRSQGNTPPGGSSVSTNRLRKEKLYCLCRTPYDETKFYVGCDLCNNWFHGECVGITEEMSKSLSEFVCTECRHARDTQELYCLCKQPYDESQ